MLQLVRELRTGMLSATPHCCDGDVWGCYWRGACSGDAVMVVEQHRRECLTHVQCGGAGCAGNGMRSPVSASRGRLVLGRPSRTASGSSRWRAMKIRWSDGAERPVSRALRPDFGGAQRRDYVAYYSRCCTCTLTTSGLRDAELRELAAPLGVILPTVVCFFEDVGPTHFVHNEWNRKSGSP
jgi:hypothetical protein